MRNGFKWLTTSMLESFTAMMLGLSLLFALHFAFVTVLEIKNVKSYKHHSMNLIHYKRLAKKKTGNTKVHNF